MAEAVHLGIDIGGTKVNLGLVNEQGVVLAKKSLASDAGKEPQVFVSEIAQAAHALTHEYGLTLADVRFIGAGVPGTVDTNTGFVSYCPNLFWFDVPIGEHFRKAFGREVLVAQDSRNGALAEFCFGAGRGLTDLICITIGTGIGCGIILGGKVFNGAMNTAGELGHTPIRKDGCECLCGNRGCLERYAGGKGMAEIAAERFPDKFIGREKRAETIFELAYAGDEEMLAYIAQVVDDLAFGIANAVSLLSPQAIVISGGMCVHEELIVKPLREGIYAHGYFSWTRLKQLKVVKAELGSDAPMIGASALNRGR